MEYSPTSDPSVRLFCRVDVVDVEAMLDAYDSGMCDISTANCISQVIARQLSCDRRIPLHRHNKTTAELEIRGRRIPLSTELLKWLDLAETGSQVDPVEFVLQIPEGDAAVHPAAPLRLRPAHKRRSRSRTAPLG